MKSMSWVYLQPFCSTFFTFFTLFSILFRERQKHVSPRFQVLTTTMLGDEIVKGLSIKMRIWRVRTFVSKPPPPKPPHFDEIIIKFKFNAMKLMKLIENEFKLHDTRTQTPPKQPHFDEIVIKFKFNALKLIKLMWHFNYYFSNYYAHCWNHAETGWIRLGLGDWLLPKCLLKYGQNTDANHALQTNFYLASMVSLMLHNLQQILHIRMSLKQEILNCTSDYLFSKWIKNKCPWIMITSDFNWYIFVRLQT